MRNHNVPLSIAALLVILLVTHCQPTQAAAQTLPSTPRLSEGHAWAAQLKGGLMILSGEVESSSVTASEALVFVRGRISGGLRGFMLFSEHRQGSPPTEVQSERYALESSARLSLNGPFYLVLNGDWERDPDQGVDHRLVGTGGVGATLLGTSTFHLDLEGSGGFVREEVRVGDVEHYLGLGTLARARWELSETANLAGEVEMMMNAAESDNVQSNADIELTIGIGGPLTLSVSYLLSHDTDPSPVYEPADIHAPAAAAEGTVGVFTVQFGVSFR